MAELKTKVVRGFAWNVAEKLASALFQIYVSIKVANRLFPEDYGVMAIMVAFLAVFNIFVDSGFSQALIRKTNPSEGDFSSAFYFNIAVSLVVYGFLVGISWPVARIFDTPAIIRLAPVLYLAVPLGALSIIQQTVFTRNFDFRRLSVINFVSIVGAGVTAILLAVGGYGIWALIGQRVTQMGIRAVLMWIFGRWKPSARFSWRPIREMYSYSSRILGTDLINIIYANVPQFVIGHIHKGTLGNYDMARKLKDLPVTSTLNSMQAVTFPALSNLKDDDAKFVLSVGKVVSSIVFIMFPMMAGLIVVAPDFFALFLKPQWQGAVPFFRILCLTGFLVPVTVISYNIMKSRSDGKAVVRAEMVKKALATVVLAATIPFGAIPIAWGQVAIALTDMLVSFTVGRRYSGYGMGRLLRDVMPALLVTLAMAGAVYGVGFLVGGLALWLRLTVKVVIGVAVYLGLSALFRLDAFGEFTEVLRKVTGKIKT